MSSLWLLCFLLLEPFVTTHGINTNIRKVIIDCDGDVNDILALTWMLTAFKDEKIEIEAITTVSGRTALFDAYRNIMHTLNFALPTEYTPERRLKMQSIPIAKANSKFNQSKSQSHTKITKREENMDGILGYSEILYKFPSIVWSKKKIKKRLKKKKFTPYSEDLIIEKILESPNDISFIGIGPLTNLHRAELKHPGIVSKIKDIYIMGGDFLLKHGEFNFDFDSDALRGVMNAINNIHDSLKKPNVFIFPVDITKQLTIETHHIGLLYTLMHQSFQMDIEMCRMKVEQKQHGLSDDQVDYGHFNGDDQYNEYDDHAGMDKDYMEDTEHFECNQLSLFYILIEHLFEKGITKQYMSGNGDGLELYDPSVIGFLLYPNLFDFKSAFCNVNASNGMIFDQRLPHLDKDTITIPNCFIALGVDSKQFIHVFIRDLANMFLVGHAEYLQTIVFEDMYGTDYGDSDYHANEYSDY